MSSIPASTWDQPGTALKELYKHKIIHVLGSNDKA